MRSASRPASRARRLARVNAAAALGSGVRRSLSGGDKVRFDTGSSGLRGAAAGHGPRTRTTWSLRGSSEGSVPYLAGGPARIWHLADLASVGCRGIDGPVPPPLWISTSSVVERMMPVPRALRKGERVSPRGEPFLSARLRIGRRVRQASCRRRHGPCPCLGGVDRTCVQAGRRPTSSGLSAAGRLDGRSADRDTCRRPS